MSPRHPGTLVSLERQRHDRLKRIRSDAERWRAEWESAPMTAARKHEILKQLSVYARETTLMSELMAETIALSHACRESLDRWGEDIERSGGA